MYQTATTLLVFVAMLAALSGCGSGRPKPYPTTGRITYQGKPVSEGTIVFHPAHGRPAVGVIAADGSYRLTTFEQGDGALPGRYAVTIESRRTSAARPKTLEEELSGVGAAQGLPTVIWLVPEKYANQETTPLTAEVHPGPNTIDFNF
jgi:hypothetical protein